MVAVALLPPFVVFGLPLAAEDLSRAASPSAALQALDLVLASLKQDKQGKADQQQLKAALKIEPQELCRRQANCKC